MRFTRLFLIFASGVCLLSAGVGTAGARSAWHHPRSGRGRYAQNTRKTTKQRNSRSVLADGFVRGSGVLFAGVAHTPEPTYLHGVSIHSGIAGSPTGTYCLELTTGASAFGAVVTVGSAELPYPASETALPYVTWLSHAPDCASKQLEVRTFTYVIKGAALDMAPSNDVSFSFVVSG
jgi:hypothetical protein